MAFKFEVDKIVQYLDKFKEDLPTLYTWDAEISRLTNFGVLESDQVNAINQKKQYEQVLILRGIINKELNESYDSRPEFFNELCLWLIQDWGKIKAGKEKGNKELFKLIHTFVMSKKAGFKRIASLSKVAVIGNQQCTENGN